MIESVKNPGSRAFSLPHDSALLEELVGLLEDLHRGMEESNINSASLFSEL